MREKIKYIILDEFTKLINTIETDFIVNFNKKRNNFLLNQLDEKMIAHMVFVSSFESKSGFAIEASAKRIARIRFGDENVPTIVNPHNLKHNIDDTNVKGQLIVTDVNTDSGDLRGQIATFRATNVATGKGKLRIESGITQDSIKNLLYLSKTYVDTTVHTKPVDLAFFDGTDWNVFEIKAGGDLDSSNAPSNIEKLLTIYTALNMENTKIYFSALYNKNGEGKTWTGSVKKHMRYPEMFLIGENFWDRILPVEITFAEFTHIYKEALEEIDLNKRINDMISLCLGEMR